MNFMSAACDNRACRAMNSTGRAGSGQIEIDLPVIVDSRGRLVFMEADKHVPFEIRRVFILYDIAPGQERGNHAHRTCQEFVIVVSGTMTIEMDDGYKRWDCMLTGNKALFVPPMTWIVLRTFDGPATCVVLASQLYDASDYIREYGEFVSAAGSSR